jgi:hypothetical protein
MMGSASALAQEKKAPGRPESLRSSPPPLMRLLENLSGQISNLGLSLGCSSQHDGFGRVAIGISGLKKPLILLR